MAAFTIPKPIVTFPGGAQLPVLPSRAYMEPKEGKRFVPVNIGWDGAGSTFDINFQQLTTQEFSQIVMLDVDNTQCGADVTFYFTDSSDTLVVPAESAGLFPVFTSSKQVYVASPLAFATDITRFRALNYRQDPVAHPAPQFSQVASALSLNAAGTTALIAHTISGTLTGYNGFGSFTGGGGAGSATVTLIQQGVGIPIDQVVVLIPAGALINVPLFSVDGIAVRFPAGIDVVVATAGAPALNVNVVARYRTP